MKAPKALCVVAALVVFEGTVALVHYMVQTMYYGAQVHNLVFSPDSRTVYGGGEEYTSRTEHHGMLWAWDTSTGRLRWKTHSAARVAVVPEALSPDGTGLVLSRQGLGPLLWDTSTRDLRCQLEWYPRLGGLEDAYFTPDGQRILGAFENDIQIWNARTGDLQVAWKAPSARYGWPTNVHFSADGQKVLIGTTGGYDAPYSKFFAHLWDAQSGRLLQSFAGGSSICALAPDSKSVAVAEYRSLTGNEGFSPSVTYIFRVVLRSATTGAEKQFSPNKRLRAAVNQGGYQNRPPLATLYNATTDTKLVDLEGLAGR